MVIKVEKRNGRVQTFNMEKLTRSISRAGTKFMLARQIAHKVKKRVIESENPVVASLTIRKYVIEELKKESKPAYDTFTHYRKNGTKYRKVHRKQQQKAKLRSKKIIGGHRSSRKYL